MMQLATYLQLKAKVLETYKQHYPYFQGTWQTFSASDIQNLIELIGEKTKQSISEKWIYTHLKPAQVEKLPRKDMLDILAQFSGYSGWDEFCFKLKKEPNVTGVAPSKKRIVFFIIAGIIILFWVYQCVYAPKKVIELQNSITKELIKDADVEAVLIENNEEKLVPIKNAMIEIQTKSDDAKLVVKSPFFKEKTIPLKELPAKITLEPDDYALMLKAFLQSDIKDWQTRKEQLHKILADDVEVLLLLPDDLGIEYFNKDEFSQRIIVPSESNKKLKIIEIQHNENQQIQLIRLKQN